MEKKSKITAMLSVLLVSAPSTAKKITTSNLRNNAMKTTAVEIEGVNIDDLNTKKALVMLEIDELGLDAADRNLLNSIIENYGSKPIGLNTIAALTGDETTTIEDFYEPFLLQIGFIQRTPRGRVVTKKAYNHLGKEWKDE